MHRVVCGSSGRVARHAGTRERRGRAAHLGRLRGENHHGNPGMILISHPTGNPNVREAALALAQAGLLGEFWTTLNWNPDGWCNRFLPAWIAEMFSRRAYPPEV